MWIISKDWWLLTLDRVIKTGAQAALVVIGGEIHPRIDVDWGLAWGGIAAMMLAALLTSIITTPLGKNKNDPQVL